MKRLKKSFLAVCFAAVAAVLFFTAAPLRTEAAEEEKTVTIDGVVYTLGDLSRGTYGEARLEESSTREEVYIRNEVEYEGEYYPIATFSWDDDAFVYRERGFADGWEDIDMERYVPVHHTLRKVTVAPDVDVVGRAINYMNLEEVSFEGKISYPFGIFYYNCPSLKNIHIPADYSLPEHENAYIDIKRCPSVQITVDEANPHFRVIDNDIYSKDGKELYNVTTDVENYRVRDGVTKIRAYALNGSHQIRKVYIPDSVKKIGENALGCMDNLRSVRMSRSVKKLDKGVFKCSRKLKKLDLPQKMREFAGQFGGTYYNKFKKITIRAKSIKDGQFGSLSPKCNVYVRSSKVKNQLRKFGFEGTVIVKKNLK